MSAPPNSYQKTKFFGLELDSLWQDVRNSWRGMAEWPVFSWAWPKLAVRLWLPTGQQALCRSMHASAVIDKHLTRSAHFDAIVLPETLLLRRSIHLPKLQPSELQAALALEIQTLSPFATEDVIWTHENDPQTNDAPCIHIAITSRKLIDKHIEVALPQLRTQTAEVWIPRITGPGYMAATGFGENIRQRKSLQWRWASALLVMLALTLILAIAVTPSAKLYIQLLQANQAMASLQQKAGPVLAQRESLVRASEKLTSLAELIGKPVPPLQILSLITDALPDDTSLLNLQIQGLNVTISGQTVNASSLMKQLGSTPGLRDVKAPIPATKPLGAPRESFTIEFTIDPNQLKPAS